ncbi:MAG TPA: outer membrane lipoprotein carrier protein LolA, partial [Candidatus Binatia bacterium]|nr:outer membrane lipoprotein carrier protein LolA [Candidatus Binatia bacterium]
TAPNPGKFMQKKSRPKALYFLVFSLMTAVALFTGIGRSGAGEAANSADAIVDSLQKNYDATTDFVADFRQETEVKNPNRSLKASGKLSFKRPGKMLWSYEEPKGQFVLADGKHLFFYQPDQNQVIKSPLKNAFRGDIPLSFLLGLGNLKKDFNATLKASEETQHVLRLEPKGEAGGYSEILVGVSKSSSDIIWVSVRDAANNLTTLRFANMRKGVGLKDSLFQVQIPKGADLVELAQ